MLGTLCSLQAGLVGHKVCDVGLLLQLLGPAGRLLGLIFRMQLSHHCLHQSLFLIPLLLHEDYKVSDKCESDFAGQVMVQCL